MALALADLDGSECLHRHLRPDNIVPPIGSTPCRYTGSNGSYMKAPRNSPISMVAVEKFMLRPQMILGECILVGFQHARGNNDTGIPIEARIGGLGWIGIERCHRLWQGDRLGLEELLSVKPVRNFGHL